MKLSRVWTSRPCISRRHRSIRCAVAPDEAQVQRKRPVHHLVVGVAEDAALRVDERRRSPRGSMTPCQTFSGSQPCDGIRPWLWCRAARRGIAPDRAHGDRVARRPGSGSATARRSGPTPPAPPRRSPRASGASPASSVVSSVDSAVQLSAATCPGGRHQPDVEVRRTPSSGPFGVQRSVSDTRVRPRPARSRSASASRPSRRASAPASARPGFTSLDQDVGIVEVGRGDRPSRAARCARSAPRARRGWCRRSRRPRAAPAAPGTRCSAP